MSISGQKVEKLEDFLARLFEPPMNLKMTYPPSLHRLHDSSFLTSQYESVIQLANTHGDLEHANKSK